MARHFHKCQGSKWQNAAREFFDCLWSQKVNLHTACVCVCICICICKCISTSICSCVCAVCVAFNMGSSLTWIRIRLWLGHMVRLQLLHLVPRGDTLPMTYHFIYILASRAPAAVIFDILPTLIAWDVAMRFVVLVNKSRGHHSKAKAGCAFIASQTCKLADWQTWLHVCCMV